MKELIQKMVNVYTIGSFLIGGVIGILGMYYTYQEELHVLQEKVNSTKKLIERLENEDKNIYDVLHLHYRKILDEH